MLARPLPLATLLLATALLASAAHAQPAPPPTPVPTAPPMAGHMDMPAPVPGTGIDGSAMSAAMTRMDRDMMGPGTRTGDPDRDLVAMMIPHHQGAIDMARIYLRAGRDPQIRRMAQKIIADQQREIRDMRAWQRRHGVDPAPAPR